MKPRKFSFKTKLIVLVEAVIIFTNVILGYGVWKEIDNKVREISRQKLMAIAASSAAVINVPAHEAIKTDEDMDSDGYKEIHALLHKLVQANPGVDDIYTMRKTDKEDIWTFVATGNETRDKNGNGAIEPEEEQVVVGEEYDVSEFPQMKTAFSGMTADYDTSCDSWGCYLSGYAPIIDESGNAVAIVGVDVLAEDTVAYERSSKILFSSVISLILVLFPAVMYFFLNILARPVEKIVAGIESFSKDLSSRMKIETGDEFELIGNSFNMMAKQTQDLYSGLEDRVKEKTKRLEESLKVIEQDKAKDDAILASIGEGMITIDENGKIIMMNNQAEVVLGAKKEETIGKHCEEVVAIIDEKGEKVNEENRPVAASLRNGEKVVASNYSYVRKDGLKVPVIISSSPVIFDKKIIAAVVLFRDISEEKRIDRAKSEFVSLASHQLLTPLSNIGWFSEMLMDKEEKKTKKKQEEYLMMIKNSTERMVILVQALLNVSRIELGTFIVDPKSIDILKVLDEVIDEYKLDIDGKLMKISKHLETGIPNINADSLLLRIIFQNLISNAIKYSNDRSEVEVTVSVTNDKAGQIDPKNGKIIIQVSDHGLGIPKDQQEKIFSKLFRANNVLETDTQGTGLGLYITKSIIDISGGSIWFESQENKGTTFYVSFPLSGMKEKKGNRILNEIKKHKNNKIK
jgi:PAS domain S-box-containing protein